MGRLWLDLQFAFRVLLKRPGFSAVAVLTLALGIGANTAIFTVVNAVLLRPLPYQAPDRVFVLGRYDGHSEDPSASEPQFLIWQQQNKSFEAISLYQPLYSGANLAGGSEPEYIAGLRVSADFFQVLGAVPSRGRSFSPQEDRPGGERVAILSDGLWRRRFAADSELIGRTVLLNNQSYTVIGIMPADFQFSLPADVIVPLRPSMTGDQDDNYGVIGRLKPGITQQQGLADMKLADEQFKAAYPKRKFDYQSVSVQPFQENLTAGVRPLLLILLGAVGFVLLIACANVAHLQLARAASRQREMAIRLALGAGWMRIVRQLVTEGLLLSLASGLAGLLLAFWGSGALTALLPERMIPSVGKMSLDRRVFGFTILAAVVTGVLFSLAPAIQAASVDVNRNLKKSSLQGIKGGLRGRLRSTIVIAEVALSLLLLVGATLLIRTFVNLRNVKPGFNSSNLLTFQVSLNGQPYDTNEKTLAFYRQGLDQIKSLPGVEAAAITSNLPLSVPFRMPFGLQGQPDHSESVQFRAITADYFQALKIPVQQGRAFAETDTQNSEAVALINEAFARKYLNETAALGRHITIGRGAGAPQYQIVGVIGDTKQFSLGSDAPPTFFVPAAQTPERLMLAMRRFTATNFVVRTTNDPLALSEPVKREIRKIDPTLPLANVRSMDQILSRSVAQERFNMSLLMIFAGLGLVLATVGIYGVMSYTVAQSTREIGIRMALGAKKSDVLKLIIRHGLSLTLAGVVLGIAGAFGLTRLITTWLYGVTPLDPLSFIGVSGLLALTALAACYLPARRATNTDPNVALRCE